MSRLTRIEQNLLPDQRSSLENLRRLISTLTDLQKQEESADEEFRTREAALRAEIEDFTGSRTQPGSGGTITTVNAAVGGDTKSIRDFPEDPLAEKAGDKQKFREQQHQAVERRSLEGKALLAEGLLRIEAAHVAAAAEREIMATRLSRLRLAVARRQREEDATPGHAELLQYLLRFEELGLHAREREKQLRRCQAERSTLALTRETLANESRLLESVVSGVEEASKQKAAREAYMRQLDGMIQVQYDGCIVSCLVNFVCS